MGFVSLNFWPLEGPGVQLHKLQLAGAQLQERANVCMGHLPSLTTGSWKVFLNLPAVKEFLSPKIWLYYEEFTYKENVLVLDSGERCSSRLWNLLFAAQMSSQLSCGSRVWTALAPSLNPLCTAAWKIRPFRFIVCHKAKINLLCWKELCLSNTTTWSRNTYESFGYKLHLRD